MNLITFIEADEMTTQLGSDKSPCLLSSFVVFVLIIDCSSHLCQRKYWLTFYVQWHSMTVTQSTTTVQIECKHENNFVLSAAASE